MGEGGTNTMLKFTTLTPIHGHLGQRLIPFQIRRVVCFAVEIVRDHHVVFVG